MAIESMTVKGPLTFLGPAVMWEWCHEAVKQAAIVTYVC